MFWYQIHFEVVSAVSQLVKRKTLSIMDKGKNPLPPRILILLDRLSNVQFSQLTRKQLKDQVEELKTALIEEFIKLKPGYERPKPSVSSHVDSSDRSRVANTPVTVPIPTRKDTQEVKKPISKPDLKEPRKETASLPSKNAIPAKPSYADLLKIAESVSKDPSPVRAISREAFKDNGEDRRHNGSNGNRGSSHKHQSPPRSRSKDVQRRDLNRNEKSKPDLNSRNSINRGKSDNRNNQHKSASDAKYNVNKVSMDDRGRNSKEGSKDQPKPKKKEVKKSKKEEEEELLARKKQKIQEEIQRVKIRDEVLAGKRSANDLKNVVKRVSHGNTVLSCRPASSSSSKRDELSFGRPPIQRSEDERGRRSRDEYLNEYEDEDEEDMDSFIDDDDGRDMVNEGSPDVSKAIRDIFGYDKRKYIGMDEDIEEASYSQILKEEARSQRIGRQEDLADMREEMRQKRLKKERLKKLK